MAKVRTVIAQLQAMANRPIYVDGEAQIGGGVTIQGGKNTANKLIAAAVALPGKYTFKNFPIILDPLELLQIAEHLGATVDIDEASCVVELDTRHITNQPIPFSMTKSTTSAFGFAGALLGRFGNVTIGKPGGDQIGARPVNLHVAAFETMGASVQDEAEQIVASWDAKPLRHSLRLEVPSTGAAVNAALAAAASRSQIEIKNCPRDTDLINMAAFLSQLSIVAALDGDILAIDATGFRPDQTVTTVCAPDRNDSFTWLAFGACSRSGLEISGMDVSDLRPGLDALQEMGAQIQIRDGVVRVRQPKTGLTAPRTPIIAGLSPRVHSDWAPFIEVLLSLAKGESTVIDTLFSRRIRQAEILQMMGADVTIGGGPAPDAVTLHFRVPPDEALYIFRLRGPNALTACDVAVGNDVRACASALLAASQANGTSQLSDMRALYRGYQKVHERLAAVGVVTRFG